MEPILPVGRTGEGAPPVAPLRRLTPVEREAARREREQRRRERARQGRPGAPEGVPEQPRRDGGGSLDVRA